VGLVALKGLCAVELVGLIILSAVEKDGDVGLNVVLSGLSGLGATGVMADVLDVGPGSGVERLEDTRFG
jgi:hypothetical protein